jgi:3-oxoacyl-[acyl-carrier protein] reductase
LRFARDGFAVVINYAGNRDKAAEVVKEITGKGGRAIAVQADVADAAGVARLFDEAEKAHGKIGAVVNSAGIMKLFPIASGKVEDFDAVFNINVHGTFNVLQQAAKRVADSGRIITVSTSVLRDEDFELRRLCGLSKLRSECSRAFLRTNCAGAVSPPSTRSRRARPGPSCSSRARLKSRSTRKLAPMERLGTPEDIANVISFLAGPEGGWINAQTLRANGGYT